MVVRQVQLVEAGVGFWQLMLARVPVDRDPLDSVHADHVGETLDRYFGGARDELDQFG